MAKNFTDLARDLSRRMADVERTIRRDVPVYLAVAWERMKDANFSAQGFVRGGTANPRWPPRKKETHLSKGKRILHSTGLLQNSVRFTPGNSQVRGWVDLGKVPYARVHNEGGAVRQNVRPFSRRTRGGTVQVRGFSRTLKFPARQYLGPSPDIFKAAQKDIADDVYGSSFWA